jgi:hypothetical protein
MTLRAVCGGVPIRLEPFDGPFGRTFAMADPDGSRVKIYGGPAAPLAAAEELSVRR